MDADVDTEINKMKAPYTKEEFDQQLAERHMTAGRPEERRSAAT